MKFLYLFHEVSGLSLNRPVVNTNPGLRSPLDSQGYKMRIEVLFREFALILLETEENSKW
jgi:hypothetical protein